jgi:hypothetical protein
LSRTNESQEYLYKTLDDIYSKKIVDDISLDGVTTIFKNVILFLILSLISGLSISFISDKPVSKIGNDIIIVSISLLSLAAVPVFIITPEVSIVKMVADYLLQGLYKQIIIGIVFLVIGIILIVVGKKKGK